MGGAHVLAQDTENMGVLPTGKALYIQFSPGQVNDGQATPVLTAPRLNAEAAKYNKFRIRYVNISYKAISSTYAKGSVAIGIMAGKKDKAIKDASTILKLRPARVEPCWRSTSISVGASIQSQMLYLTNTVDDDDAVPFTIYLYSDADTPGYIEISYAVEFSFPKP